jgi:hypothetical protein
MIAALSMPFLKQISEAQTIDLESREASFRLRSRDLVAYEVSWRLTAAEIDADVRTTTSMRHLQHWRF